ncbi:hypothetical protein AcV7_002047 [Taiwanofungus camphoratus]|nr:hypothetical protein AcV7_002047 [Antrodia cinnamomea]
MLHGHAGANERTAASLPKRRTNGTTKLRSSTAPGRRPGCAAETEQRERASHASRRRNAQPTRTADPTRDRRANTHAPCSSGSWIRVFTRRMQRLDSKFAFTSNKSRGRRSTTPIHTIRSSSVCSSQLNPNIALSYAGGGGAPRWTFRPLPPDHRLTVQGFEQNQAPTPRHGSRSPCSLDHSRPPHTVRLLDSGEDSMRGCRVGEPYVGSTTARGAGCPHACVRACVPTGEERRGDTPRTARAAFKGEGGLQLAAGGKQNVPPAPFRKDAACDIITPLTGFRTEPRTVRPHSPTPRGPRDRRRTAASRAQRRRSPAPSPAAVFGTRRSSRAHVASPPLAGGGGASTRTSRGAAAHGPSSIHAMSARGPMAARCVRVRLEVIAATGGSAEGCNRARDEGGGGALSRVQLGEARGRVVAPPVRARSGDAPVCARVSPVSRVYEGCNAWSAWVGGCSPNGGGFLSRQCLHCQRERAHTQSTESKMQKKKILSQSR